MSDIKRSPVDRRNFLRLAGTASLTPLVAGAAAAQQQSGVSAGTSSAAEASMSVRFVLNGSAARLDVDPRSTLLDAVREHAGLTGTKKGCDHGQCGACTVLRDGVRVLSCLTLAASVEGQNITTIEGLQDTAGGLHPMQQAFIDHDAFQCGYCTPGQIVSAVACVREGHASSDDDIREYMSGNLCRCAAYPNIVAAVRQGRETMGG